MQGYKAADLIAPTLHAHFARHLEDAKRRGQSSLASLPPIEDIARLVDAAFWASLRHEEGYLPKISLAFLDPGQTAQPMLFERPIPLDPAALAKVAPAVERVGIHLGVSPGED